MAKNYREHKINVETISSSNHLAERAGIELEATQILEIFEYHYENEELDLYYNVKLQENGEISIEARDTIRKYANSPHADFEYNGHIQDIERGPNSEDWLPFNFFTENMYKLLEEPEEYAEELEIFLSQIQRTTVAWESQKGEAPSPYR